MEADGIPATTASKLIPMQEMASEQKA